MFEAKYDLNKIVAADYNPRKISDNQFEKLKESVKELGTIKPLIINKNGVIVAGHQRSKAMKCVGIKEAPVFILEEQVAVVDEIKFNLMHNSIETETSEIIINDVDEIPFGFSYIRHDKITILKKSKPHISKEITKLLIRYGEFGSCIIDVDGNVIHNSDYAFVCKLQKKDLLIYKHKGAEIVKYYFNEDYGKYNYDVLGIKPYVQVNCQMHRNGTTIRSTLYENFVIPKLEKEKRYIDFGAGECFYANYLKNKGYMFQVYEPNFRNKNSSSLNVKKVIWMIENIQNEIKEKGLFDFCVLDSVINSITSMDFQHCVMLSCASLLKDDGTLFLGTRNKGKIEAHENFNKSNANIRLIEFLDENDFSATFRKGVFTLQKFHTLESLEKMCKEYFEEVEVIGEKSKSQIYAICRKPLRYSEEETLRVLEKEFNMEYPNGFKHNKHLGLINLIIKEIFR